MASNYESVAKKRYIPKTVSDAIVENRAEGNMAGDDVPETPTTITTKVAVEVRPPLEPASADSRFSPEEYYDDDASEYSDDLYAGAGNSGDTEPVHGSTPVGTGAGVTGDDEDERSLWLGLKVYTQKQGNTPSDRKDSVVIEGWFKNGENNS